jgi:glutamate synthase domain-containing protein 3
LVEFDCAGLTPREVNARLGALAFELAAAGYNEEILVLHPHAMHNFCVGLKTPVRLRVQGSLGSYAGGFMNGPQIVISGNAGWYAGDNMMGGSLIVEGNAGSNTGPSMIGGMLRVRGKAGNRVGYALKGGSLIVEGSAGFETGKMMMGGRIVLCEGVGRKVGESMYGGFIHVRGRIEGLGGNIETGEPPPGEREVLQALLDEIGAGLKAGEFTTIKPRPGKHSYKIFTPGHRPREMRAEKEEGAAR